MGPMIMIHACCTDGRNEIVQSHGAGFRIEFWGAETPLPRWWKACPLYLQEIQKSRKGYTEEIGGYRQGEESKALVVETVQGADLTAILQYGRAAGVFTRFRLLL